MTAENRFQNHTQINFSKDDMFKPELQGLFSKTEMVGFVGYGVNLPKGKVLDKVMVLTNLGMLILDIAKVRNFLQFLDFYLIFLLVSD